MTRICLFPKYYSKSPLKVRLLDQSPPDERIGPFSRWIKPPSEFVPMVLDSGVFALSCSVSLYRVLNIQEGVEGDHAPMCLGGRGAAPPEFC